MRFGLTSRGWEKLRWFLLVGVASWFITTLLAFLHFKETWSFLELFYLPLFAFYIRLIFFTLFALFGFLVAKETSKTEKREKELKESRKKYRAIVEQTHDAIAIYRGDHFLFVNDRMCELHGFSKKELYEMELWDLFPPEEREQIQAIARKRRMGKDVPSRYEVRVLTKEGDIKYCDFAVTSITYEGEYAALVAVRDITKRKKLEEKLETLHQWGQRLNRADSMEKIFEYTLNAMEQTLGFNYAAIGLKKGDHLHLVASRGYGPIPENLKRRPLTGNGIAAKVAKTGDPILTPDVKKNETYIQLHPAILSELAVPIHTENRIIGVLNVASEEKNGFDQDDHRLLETLASHVAVAIEKIREMKKRVSLQRLDELRNQFLTMAAHEIRTPLTPIRTNLEILKRGSTSQLTKEQERKISRTLDSVERLNRLVEDFRRISKSRAKTINLETSHHLLVNTIEKALQQYKKIIGEEKLFVVKQLHSPCALTYDEDRIIQVVSNLVENAIDYTEDKIWIEVGKNEEYVFFSIKDNGCGIPKEEQDKIFKPFYRVEEEGRSREDRRFGGTGLGLNICKQIIEAHGGEIYVDSKIGKGTTFTVTIPRDKKKERGKP